jgi:nucleoside-diphosphate-sugar epimerase
MTNVLLTGASGFLGRAIKEQLSNQYSFVEVSRQPETDIVCDLANEVPKINQHFEIIIHAAGKAHVIPRSTKEAEDFFKVNVSGTWNLLKGVEMSGLIPKAIIFISSVSVYGLDEGEGIHEEFKLHASDPYGMSKIKAEQTLIEWCQVHQVSLTILRLPLIVGHYPPGNLGKMISGLRNRRYLRVNQGRSRKSMVIASDVASIIPSAVIHPGIYNLTDRYHPSFLEIENAIAERFELNQPVNISLTMARALGLTGDLIDLVRRGISPINSARIKKIIATLTFDDSKAFRKLGWTPNRVIDFIKHSIQA